jgi:hypothetical protein
LCRIPGPRGEDYYRSVKVDFEEFAFHALGWIRARGRAKAATPRPSATFADHYFFCTLVVLTSP